LKISLKSTLLIKYKIKMRYPKLIHLFLFLTVTTSVFAQKFGYPKVEERQLIGTKWRYSYTLHLETNTTVHQADKDYQYFLFFKYDFSFEQFLHGKFSKGNWSLSGSTLFYPFRNIQKFDIAAINNKALVLEFQQTNATGTYQYHFVTVESKEAPFVRPVDELPEIIVEAEAKQTKKRPWWAILRGGEDKKEDLPKKKEPVYFSAELVGGGYYGGIDPVVKDFIRINSDGRLVQEFQTVSQPLRVNKKSISKQELEQFGEWVTEQKFFDMQRLYDCSSPVCEKRKMLKPTPIPLRLMIAYGDKRKVITLAIWGQDQYKMRYVNYPPALDNIIDAIQKMANRIEVK
jgi:hypothetical protein